MFAKVRPWIGKFALFKEITALGCDFFEHVDVKRVDVKKKMVILSLCEVFFFRDCSLEPTFRVKKRKMCFCCACAHKIPQIFQNFFTFTCFMFYVCIKWPRS